MADKNIIKLRWTKAPFKHSHAEVLQCAWISLDCRDRRPNRRRLFVAGVVLWCLWLWCYWVGPLHRRKGIAHHSRCGHVVGVHMVTSQQRFFMLSTKIEAVQQELCHKEGGGGSNCRQTNVLFFHLLRHGKPRERGGEVAL